MLELLGEAQTVALVGLLGGIALGLAARIGRFCTLGAIEDLIYGSDDRRMRMWLVAIGVAIIGTHLAISLDMFDASQAAYLDRGWNPAGTIIGGLMFGYGMAISGNCGYGALARLGGGDLRSFVIVLVMGLSAYFVMSGPLAHLRVTLFPVETVATSAQSFPQLFEGFGIAPLTTGLVAGGALLIWAVASADMRHSTGHLVWGAVSALPSYPVGLALTGWPWLGLKLSRLKPTPLPPRSAIQFSIR